LGQKCGNVWHFASPIFLNKIVIPNFHCQLPHPIPPNSSAKHVGGLVHSRTQPDGSSFAAAMPIQECANANGKQRQRIVTTTRRAKKPMPKPRSTINLQDGDNAGQQQQKNHNQKG
jgi:hypothetical protein